MTNLGVLFVDKRRSNAARLTPFELNPEIYGSHFSTETQKRLNVRFRWF